MLRTTITEDNTDGMTDKEYITFIQQQNKLQEHNGMSDQELMRLIRQESKNRLIFSSPPVSRSSSVNSVVSNGTEMGNVTPSDPSKKITF